MNFIRHLDFHSVITRSPDEPAAPEPVIEPVIDPVAEPAPQPDAPVEDTAADPAPVAAALAPAPAPERVIPAKTFERVVAEVREDKRQATARAEAAERRAAEFQAIIERLQSGNPDPAAAPVARPAAPAAPAHGTTEFDSAVQAAAAKQRLYDDTLVVRSTGEGAFPDFNQSLGILTALGATNDDFVSDVLAVDKAGAHVIFDKLAKDPEKAASLVTMDSRRRIAELTRMAVAPKTDPATAPAVDPARPAVSRAPAPAPRLAPVAPAAQVDPTTPEGNEKMSDAQFEKWYKEKHYKRA